MDEIDLAQQREECERAETLRRVRNSAADEDSPSPDGGEEPVICRDCGAPIPRERLAAQRQAVRCIDCQRDYDREQALEAKLYADGRAF